ncbi:MAG: hypothetical protein HYS09_02735 [Chloroflexi bacterium]|nr:hypothetical protein [Chloroflexota bacterium]
MQYRILLVCAFVVLGVACEQGTEAPQTTGTPTGVPTQTPAATATGQASPPADGEADVRDLLLRSQDVPAGLIPADAEPGLASGEAFSAEMFFADQLASGAITQSDVDSWGTISAATQAYNGAGRLPRSGVEFLQVTVVLHTEAGGAGAFFDFPGTIPTRSEIEDVEASPGRTVVSFEELSEPAFGDASELLHFVSSDPDEEDQAETYWFFMRRERVVGSIQIRALEGLVTLEQVAAIANNLDVRVEQAFR